VIPGKSTRVIRETVVTRDELRSDHHAKEPRDELKNVHLTRSIFITLVEFPLLSAQMYTPLGRRDASNMNV
jgi:hypothetical protein